MQHNVILPTESKKGKKLGPRKNKTLRTSKPQIAPPIIRQTQAIVLPNITPLNLASSHNSQDDQSVASEDSWAHQVPKFFFLQKVRTIVGTALNCCLGSYQFLQKLIEIYCHDCT